MIRRPRAAVFPLRTAVLVLALVTAGRAWPVDVFVEALLPNLAVLQIDGKRVTLRAGESSGELTLISSDARSAVVEINGEQRQLQVSQRISSAFSQPEAREVVVRRDERLQYRTNAEINGVRLPVLVDTGANMIALNARQALAVGIGRNEGTPARVQTASDVLPARQVTLDSVDVGGIRVDAVTAMIIDGEQPSTVLLGMSFLQHVDMQEKDGVLTLRGRW
ncbi:MAG: TIGR02281 family clan AA aspartic protease [Pseudomonadota bacterium]